MRLLLDTHVFLWWLGDSRRLGKTLKEALLGAEDAFVSAASVWEIAIKTSIGKLDLADEDFDALERLIAQAGFRELPVSAGHAKGVRRLPFHHADPFDRLLVAQARAEALTIATTDRVFKAYDVPTLLRR